MNLRIYLMNFSSKLKDHSGSFTNPNADTLLNSAEKQKKIRKKCEQNASESSYNLHTCVHCNMTFESKRNLDNHIVENIVIKYTNVQIANSKLLISVAWKGIV
ncbi:unnamed protein product [Acanthoscelides obtectus]|uniref:Zinc finger double-stranded RNA binding domain-containing protein n=1 Tax=Acanthoscelides obtectus TaxID=200917 RepID=A0A9P0QB11_ACAOB|nr:unnamed protein product [Acanthoscelides obtectus]CAK1684233.1 hypothetical protein AOBTE_LOCUS34729 [Acanthoscelides obtectus]